MFKKWLPIRVHKVSLFSGFCLLGHLWGPNPLFDIESGPQRSQSASNDRKLTQKWYQRAPRLRKRAPKDKPFRALRNIMKQKNAMTQHTHIFTIMKNAARRTAQKVTPKDPKRSKNYFKCAFVGGPGLADCAKRFQLTDKTTLKCGKEFEGKGAGANTSKNPCK